MIEKINPIRAGDGLLDGIVAGLEEYLQLVPGYPGCFPAIIAKPQVLILVFLSGWVCHPVQTRFSGFRPRNRLRASQLITDQISVLYRISEEKILINLSSEASGVC